MAFWGVGIVIAPIVAPMLGGWLTTDYSWRWVFFINLPISLIGLFLVWTYVFDPPYIRRTSTRIDYWGMGLLAIGIGALQVVFDKGQEDDWFGSHFIVTMTVIAVIGLVAFTMWELRTRDAVVHFRPVPLSHIRDRHEPLTGAFLFALRQHRAACRFSCRSC